MATRTRGNGTRTVPGLGSLLSGPQADLVRVLSGSGVTYTYNASFTSVEPAGELKFSRGGAASLVEFWSERAAEQVTISGSITFAVYHGAPTGGWEGKHRCRLYVVRGGGSDVRTLIVTATSETFSASGQEIFAVTPDTPVTVVRGDRFMLLVTTVEDNAVGAPHSIFTGSADVTTIYVEFTETFTFLDNLTRLYLRRTVVNAIDDFRDMLAVRGSSAATTGVTATEEAAEELQCTLEAAQPFLGVNISAAAIQDTSNASTYVSGSFTPVADRLYFLSVTHSDAAPETTVPTITTTTGLTFVEVATIVFDTIASNVHRLTLFRAMESSGLSAGTYTVNFADAATGCCALLSEVPDLVTTGADGADAVRNIISNNANASANPSITLGAFNDVRNGVFACFASDIATVPTAGAGFTGLGHATIGTPTKGVFAEFQAGNDTSVNCTLASSDWAGIAVELVRRAEVSTVYLEWISGRVKESFSFTAADQFSGRVYAHESDALANLRGRVKLFNRAPDGTRTLVATMDRTSELSTSAAPVIWGPTDGSSTETLVQATGFHEDDRVILGVYIFPNPSTTMPAGYTCTITFDHNVANITGDCWLEMVSPLTFKAEGDPARSEAVPGGMTTLGLGNDGA